MAKSRHNQQPPATSPRNMLVFMTIGALLVAGLVVWALTRTVEPSAAPIPNAVETATLPPASDTFSTSGQASGQSSVPPIPTATAGLTTSSQAPVISGSKADVPRISAEDLREKIKAGSVTVVDVRDALSYQAGHIPGSLSIPLASVEANLDLLPKGKQVITYCT